MVTVTKNIPSENDDGHSEATGAWTACDGTYGSPTDYFRVGSAQNEHSGGVRFTSIDIDQGQSITSATLSAVLNNTSPGSNIGIICYGHDTDNAGAWANNGPIPGGQGFTDTTASDTTTVTASTSAATVIEWDVTDIVQEILDRVGWSNNNAMAFALRYDAYNYSWTNFEDTNTGSTVVELEIIYTAGGGVVTIVGSLAMMGIGI